MSNTTYDSASNRTTLVTRSSAVRLKNITEDSELYLFRIPKGLFNIKDLVNKEINIGKKSSKLTINGNKYDFIVRQMDGQENSIQPWLSDSNAVLKPAGVSVRAEVRARVHLNKASVSESLEGLEQLAPVLHEPPALPARDFFGTRSSSSAAADKQVSTDKSSKKKSKRKSVAAPSVGDAVLGVLTPDEEAVVARKKRSLSLEELTPQLPQKPFKKKKQDKLVASFKDVYDDICTTPAVEAASKTRAAR